MFTRETVLTESPGSCKLCGSGDKPWYLDLHVKERLYGHIYYCSDCIADMLSVAQLDSEVAKRDKVIADQRKDIDELNAIITERDNALRFIARTKFFALADPIDPSPQDVEDVAGTSQGSAEANQQFDEPGSSKGLADVPNPRRKSGKQSIFAAEF